MIAAANAGDVSAVPALRRALAEHPELIDLLGDMAAHVERGLIALAAGSSLVGSEAVPLHLAKMRAELGEDAASPLERLLIRRVVLCWLATHQADIERATLLQGNTSEAVRTAADKRVDRAHARFLSATKTLATVRKLLKPGLSPLDLAMGMVSEVKPGVANRIKGHVGVAGN
jgi:hypothetical protein